MTACWIRCRPPRWWLAVRAAQAAAERHIGSVEAGPLPSFARQAPESVRRELGRHWKRYMAALSDDRRDEVLLTELGYLLALVHARAGVHVPRAPTKLPPPPRRSGPSSEAPRETAVERGRYAAHGARQP